MAKQNASLITLTLGLGALIGTLNITIFNVALPIMMDVFDTTLATVQWLMSGYMLAAGIIIPTAGFLGNRFGYKRLFCFALFCVLILSVVGAFAWCIEALIVVRLLFGLTSGLLSPLSLTMLYQLTPPSQQATAASTWGIANTIGGMVPICLSGFILSVANWKFLLFFNIPLVILTLLLSIYLLPKDSLKSSKLDLPGLLLTSIGSFTLLFTFSNMSAWGFSGKLLGGILIGFACLIIYVLISWHKSDALLNLSVLKFPRYVAALFVSGIVTTAIYIITFIMPLFLQTGLGISPLATGLVMFPSSVFSMIAMAITPKLYPKLGEQKLIILGILITILGSSPILFATPATSTILVALSMCGRFFGIGMVSLVATNAQMSDIPPQLSGYASALTNWFQQMLNALIIGIASNIAEFRIVALAPDSPESFAWAYTSTTNMMMFVSCLLLILVIPVACKFLKSKKNSNSI